uniref:MHD domain-containing protein n=1 Tax=Craspedostauros australis TaxID=1486917 RepID=A0A7R9WWM0_9STRA
MISNFFVLSPRGDTIIAKTYRNDRGNEGAHERSHTEAFFRKIKFWNSDDVEGGRSEGAKTDKKKGDAPPVFIMPDGLSYIHVKRNGLIFCCATARNASPTTIIEFLSTIARVFKDYCGTLSEEAIRKNFILLYELLDEMLDYGYPQITRTQNLKLCVYNEPIVVDPVTSTGNLVNPKTASANAVHKPVISSVNASGRKTDAKGTQKNEIFVDILERLNVLFSNNGYVLNSTIDGCIQMKSYLAGNPELRMALNEDLSIGRNTGSYGSVTIDDINFNDCVNLSEFETTRTLSFIPPDGEFVVLNYRVTGDFATPFRIFPSIEEVEPKKLEITILIRADMPSNHFGANVSIEMPLPKCTVSAQCSVISSPGTGHTNAEFVQRDGKILWTMKKLPGGSEQTMKAKVTLSQPCTSQIRREVGPTNMNFEIPMFNVSNLQVRYLRIAEHMAGYTPYRWVRYVTQSNSYVCRL